MKKIESNLPLILAGIGLLLLLGMIAEVVFTLPPRTFTMLTGRVGGAYYEGAVLYRDFAAQNGFTIDIVETAGSRGAAHAGSGRRRCRLHSRRRGGGG